MFPTLIESLLARWLNWSFAAAILSWFPWKKKLNESVNERVNIFFKEKKTKKKKICIGRLKEFQLFSTVETGGFLTRIIAVSCDLLTCVPLCRAGAWPFRSSFVKRPVNRLSGAAAAPEHFSSPSGGAPESLTFDIHLAGRMCRYFRWRQKRRNIWLPKNLKKWKHLLSVSTGVFKTDLRYNMVINRLSLRVNESCAEKCSHQSANVGRWTFDSCQLHEVFSAGVSVIIVGIFHHFIPFDRPWRVLHFRFWVCWD